jgi:hypothetical protein
VNGRGAERRERRAFSSGGFLAQFARGGDPLAAMLNYLLAEPNFRFATFNNGEGCGYETGADCFAELAFLEAEEPRTFAPAISGARV